MLEGISYLYAKFQVNMVMKKKVIKLKNFRTRITNNMNLYILI